MGDSEVPVKCEKRVKRDDKQDMSTAWNLIFLWINEHLLLQLHLQCSDLNGEGLHFCGEITY